MVKDKEARRRYELESKKQIDVEPRDYSNEEIFENDKRLENQFLLDNVEKAHEEYKQRQDNKNQIPNEEMSKKANEQNMSGLSKQTTLVSQPFIIYSKNKAKLAINSNLFFDAKNIEENYRIPGYDIFPILNQYSKWEIRKSIES